MSNTSDRIPKLSRPQVIRLDRLLQMDYKPFEIAELLEVHIDTVYRSYLPAGCPYEKDEKGRYWILGTAFKTWAKEILAERKNRKTLPMESDEGWCMTCNKRVKMISPKIIYSARKVEMFQSICKTCGGKVNRTRGKSE